MANPEHLEMLKQGGKAWNKWRYKTDGFLSQVDLRGADLRGVNLMGADLRGADLSQANLTEATLREVDLKKATLRGADLSQANLNGATLRWADLREANLTEATLRWADLSQADLTEADLTKANLTEANLTEANLTKANLSQADLKKAELREADLTGADLREADLTETNLVGANLTNCYVYGTSVWNVDLKETIQKDLVITPWKETAITVDNLEVAQFISLLLNNKKIRDVIDAITSKIVLILGRFTSERKAILDAIKEELHHRNYSPVLLDFEKPGDFDLLPETLSTLAHMSRFVIADLTDHGASLSVQLECIVPDLPSLPIVPLLQAAGRDVIFQDWMHYPWVLETIRYDTDAHLIEMLGEQIIGLAETKFQELTKR
jgi:uncharacterized protein YjbI with pentapeptide repeats